MLAFDACRNRDRAAIRRNARRGRAPAARSCGAHRGSADRPADLLLGQQAFDQNVELPHRPQGAHRFRFPYAASAHGDTLAVADTANNRVLLWRDLPRTGIQRPADAVLGQENFDAAGENRWKAVSDETLCGPYGLWLHGDRLAIADSGNNRVMFWQVGAAASVPAHSPSLLSTAGA